MAAKGQSVPMWVRLIVGAVMVIAWTMAAALKVACAILMALVGLIEPRRRRKVARR